MSDIIKGLTNLVESFFQIIYGTISAVVNTIVSTLQAAFAFIVSIVQGAFNISEGVVGLILGNLTLILTAAAAYYGYILYQQRQGNRNPQPIKEISGKIKQATS